MLYLAPFFIIQTIQSTATQTTSSTDPHNQTNTIVLVISYNDYQPIEYATTKKVLQNAGYIVQTASTQTGNATATDTSSTTVDLTIDTVNPNNYDGLFVIGGRGTLKHLNTKTMYSLIQQFSAAHKPFGAICLATRILARAGVLKEKKATGWDGDNELTTIFKEHNVHYIPKDVVTDGTIVTATGSEAASKFGEAIVQVLKSQH